MNTAPPPPVFEQKMGFLFQQKSHLPATTLRASGGIIEAESPNTIAPSTTGGEMADPVHFEWLPFEIVNGSA